MTLAPPAPAPVATGDIRRPNGSIYKPRAIAGIEDVALLREASRATEGVLLLGPPGTGKSALPEATFLGTPLTAGDDYTPPGLEVLVCSADTTTADFLGTITKNPDDGTYPFVDGPLTRSVRNDVPFLADEMLLADPRVLSVLYPLMDGRGFLQIPDDPRQDPIPVGPNWFLIGTGNPNVPGAELSDALRDRFVHHIEVGTDWDLALELGVPKKAVTLARALDQQRRREEIDWSPQLRSLLIFRDQVDKYGTHYAACSLLSKAPAKDLEVIREKMHAYFPDAEPLSAGGRFSA